ncbi:MAG TPA: hypothetical protein VKT81_07055 [Bryobacteraceae bacterium]|nr:hypothetical protein [Bryobacteraceae bacterium]
MRAYSESAEEALHASAFLKEWAAAGFLTEAQHLQLEQETTCDLRRTNIFLRIVLFVFTVLILVAAFFLFHPGSQDAPVLLFFFALISYAAAEIAVSQAKLYRHGVEEAFAVCSVVFLCFGLESLHPPLPHDFRFLIPATGAILSLWIWRRFGLPYAFLAALIFMAFVADSFAWSPMAAHLVAASFYCAGLIAMMTVRLRYRLTYLDQEFSIAEAFLWMAIYISVNLKLASFDFLKPLRGIADGSAQFGRPFYWTTWVLTWCLPPVILARGLPRKDRWVIAAGTIAAVLTMITNKPYLGWERHTWDPMILGAILTGAAIFIRRWLAKGPGEVRRGFTAHRLSAKDKRWMGFGTTALGFVSPGAITHAPQSGGSEPQFGGGDSGGAGASSDF